MSSFPSDSQFELCIVTRNGSADAVNWKDLPTNIYRVKPQGLVETIRGKDTLIELVDRENKEVKVYVSEFSQGGTKTFLLWLSLQCEIWI